MKINLLIIIMLSYLLVSSIYLRIKEVHFSRMLAYQSLFCGWAYKSKGLAYCCYLIKCPINLFLELYAEHKIGLSIDSLFAFIYAVIGISSILILIF